MKKTTAEFIDRHIPHSKSDIKTMLGAIGSPSLDQLIQETIPNNIQQTTPLDIPAFESEYEYFKHISEISNKNKRQHCHIGLGYYNTIVPAVIQRNIFENPGWYTQYTPYQAEISQGRLEALLNFQTVITELTNLPIANASLLDEGTAAAEAMVMLFRLRSKHQSNKHTCAVMHDIFPQTHNVVATRAQHLSINLESITPDSILGDDVFSVIIQTPNRFGDCQSLQPFIDRCTKQKIPVICCSDLMYLTHHSPYTNVEVYVGSTQRFGVPMGFGGPHAAFFATVEKNSRKIPGRIIGASIDSNGQTAYRMALQTREQHIRKEKATSNICTAQALLAIMAGMYAVYHGPTHLQNIANRITTLTHYCLSMLKDMGFTCLSDTVFDTITLCLSGPSDRRKLDTLCNEQNRVFNTSHPEYISLTFDETHSITDCDAILSIFSNLTSQTVSDSVNLPSIPIHRPLEFMQQPLFNSYHDETSMMRYIKQLENKDLSLTGSMIPLGSCTMKLNAAIEMMPLSFPSIANIHPYSPPSTYDGYKHIIKTLGQWLCTITDLDDISFQPNSGAQGEYAGILAIKRYLKSIGEEQRTIALIPVSAHGTNPASAVLAGLDVVPILCNEQGDINQEDLTKKCKKYHNQLALLMVTYPSTHGVFEEDIQTLCTIVHNHGGQVYLDGANLNAQVGLTSPGIIGADVCHINLHKTFAIPHGGGGPGMGPICVKSHLSPFLPQFTLDACDTSNSVASAPYSSASILLISYGYIGLMGGEGLTHASQIAILNANYIKARLEPYYSIVFKGASNHVAHELIIDCRPFKTQANINVEDIAKRLMDYSFHAPTLSWPVPGTLMIEPTESESLEECNRFCDAMIHIFHEIEAITHGTADTQDNLLKNAPHTQTQCIQNSWPHPYSREDAAFPVPSLRTKKFWPTVRRINQAQGDRHLICTCDTQLLETVDTF